VTLFELSLKLKGLDVAQATRELEQIGRLGPDERNRWQQEQKWTIVRFHFRNNSFYKKKIGRSLPSCWEDLPIMSKSDFQCELESVLPRGFRRHDLYVANTSGSSGHPFFFAKDKHSHARTWALIKQRYAWHHLSLDSKQARFYGIPLERWGYTAEKMKDWLMNRVRFPVFDLSDRTLEAYSQRLREVPFDYFYGYTNSLVLFARFLLGQGRQLKALCPTLKICITTAEVCTQKDRELLRKAFGVPVVNEYGASEVGVIAFENAEGEWVISDENLYLETVDSEGCPVPDGQCGNILITDMTNRAFPFIRYKIGDLGSIKAERMYREIFPRILLRLEGRENDTIVLPSGKKSPGLTFYYISRSILESSTVLREFIIRQTALNEFVFDIVSDRSITSQEKREIQKKADLYLEPGLNLKINRVPAIQRPPSGKIKHFYSEL